MAKDILSMYGSDARSGSRAKCGGDMTDCVKDVRKYRPPVGPTNQMQNSPGIHGTNHGNCGTQGKR
jgi:hypothetical protein